MSMEQLDNNLTQRIQEWLNTPPAERDLKEGAEMFHLLRPQNRILYQNFLRRPDSNAERIAYELEKVLRIRLDGLTIRQVAVMAHEIVPKVGVKLTAGYKGKREDHDALPEEIQKLYEQNGVIYEKMKALYNTLLEMENAPVCDRYEYLKMLKELDDRYNENWEAYDHFDAEKQSSEKTDSPSAGDVPTPAEGQSEHDIKEVQAARKFISSNLKKLESEEMDEKNRNQLIQEIYERVRVIDETGGTFKPDMAARLRVFGIEV